MDLHLRVVSSPDRALEEEEEDNLKEGMVDGLTVESDILHIEGHFLHFDMLTRITLDFAY